MEVTNLQRKFFLKKDDKEIILKDPSKKFSAEEVMKFYSTNYPELTTSTIANPKIEDGFAVYEFVTTFGDKG